MRIIVTDLTRFDNNEIVCTAGIELASGRCVRPMPYLAKKVCHELNILPGAILEGEFSESKNKSAPHYEDMNYRNLKFNGPCSSTDFRKALMCGYAKSVADGFGIQLPVGNRCVPRNHTPPRSIITLSVDPSAVSVVVDKYGKLKVHVTDMAGDEYRYMPITDLGFYQYAKSNVRTNNDLDKLNDFITDQQEVFVRIGLSREWTSGDGRAGYWIQTNGIYTFPNFFEEVRCYTKS